MGLSKRLSCLRLSALGITLSATTVPAATPSPISSCPYTISTPGSYAVVNDLVSSGTCITILVNSVILDLQGHTITGNGAGHGIIDNQRANGIEQMDITIKNGVISQFGTGVATSGTEFATIIEIISQQNTFDGIDPGNSSTIISTSSLQNGGNGIGGGGWTSFVNVQSDRNAGDGFNDGTNLFLTNIEANSNRGAGINIFYNLTVVDSDIENNAAGGILQAYCCAVVANNKVNNNQGSGIELGGQKVNGSQEGAALFSFHQVKGNKVIGNGGNGIAVDSDFSFGLGYASVVGNTVVQNQGIGIVLSCPGNLVGNTEQNNKGGDLVTTGPGCITIDQTAP